MAALLLVVDGLAEIILADAEQWGVAHKDQTVAPNLDAFLSGPFARREGGHAAGQEKGADRQEKDAEEQSGAPAETGREEHA